MNIAQLKKQTWGKEQKSIKGACGVLGAELIVQSYSCRKERPVIALLQTLQVDQCVAEGAAQCCDGVLQGVGLVVHQRWQLRSSFSYVPPPSTGSRVSQDGAGPPNQSIQSLPVSSLNSSAVANNSKEDGRCKNRSSGAPPLLPRPNSPEEILSSLALLIKCCGMICLVQFIHSCAQGVSPTHGPGSSHTGVGWSSSPISRMWGGGPLQRAPSSSLRNIPVCITGLYHTGPINSKVKIIIKHHDVKW